MPSKCFVLMTYCTFCMSHLRCTVYVDYPSIQSRDSSGPDDLIFIQIGTIVAGWLLCDSYTSGRVAIHRATETTATVVFVAMQKQIALYAQCVMNMS